MTLPDVETARSLMLAGVGPLGAEQVALAEADGRWLVHPVLAARDQPPFDASAMDGWAVRAGDVAPGARLRIVGESAAGGAQALRVEPGEAVRIFTGAPLPEGADRIVIQETATRDGDVVILGAAQPDPAHVRRRGGDFRDGAVLLEAGVRLNPWRIALAASAGAATVACGRAPRVAVLPNGDELVEPGEAILPHQIFNAGGPALGAFVRRLGGRVEALRAVSDKDEAIRSRVAGAEFDLLVVIGGASVGDHDRVKPALRATGAVLSVEGCAMRPGKPVWYGRLGDGRPVLGLPGNPASALVCAELFLGPLLATMQGGETAWRTETAVLAAPLPPNGPRDHYMRARFAAGENGAPRVFPFRDQDSSLVSVMAAAEGLLRRPPHAPAATTGDVVEIRRPV